MSTVLDAPPIGAQRPRHLCTPDTAISSAGQEAIDLARDVGLDLDEWQQFVLGHALAERPDGRWAAREVGEVIPRQNGKGACLEARELVGLFLVGDGLTIHSAHEFSTSLEAFGRLLALIEGTPWLMKRVRRVSRSHGDEGIDLKSGQRIRFRTRTKGGGRGFSADLVILDEAMILPVAFHGALMPVVSARPNPQIWYTGSAVDQTVHEHGEVLARVRERGISGTDPTLLYAEWSVDRRESGDDEPYTPDRVTLSVLSDESAWAEANPAYGIRITREAIESEMRAMTMRTFCVERLGIGDWPATDGAASSKIDLQAFRALVDTKSSIVGALCLAIDTSPDRAWSSISAAGTRADGLRHVELVDRRRGTGWVPDRLAEIARRHDVRVILLDAVGPAASILPALDDAGLGLTTPVVTVSAQDYARACGQVYDLVQDAGLRHLGQPEVDAAVKGAATRPLGDAWAWARKSSQVDITPLVSLTLALYGPALAPEEVSSGWRPL